MTFAIEPMLITDPNPGDLITSAWGKSVGDQVDINTAAIAGLTTGTYPGAVLGVAVGTATSYTNNTASETDITVTSGDAPSLTLSLNTSRWYRATYVARFSNATPGGEIALRLVEGGVARKALIDGPLAASARQFEFIHYFQPASSSPTIYKMTAAPVGTVGTLTASASAQSPMQFTIEDVSGGAPVPGTGAEYLASAGSATFTLPITPPWAAGAGMAINIPSRPYLRAFTCVAQFGLTHVSGGSPNYYVAQFDFTNVLFPSADLQFYGTRVPTATFQGVTVGLVAANVAANITVRLGADIAQTISFNSNTYVQATVTPSGA